MNAAWLVAAIACSTACGGSIGADEIRAMVRDAEGRSSLSADDSGLAGHDGSFFIASADDRFRLETSGQIQFRYLATFRDSDGVDDFQGGFHTRRMKLTFDGHVYDPRLQYKVTIDFDRDGGGAGLSDMWLVFEVEPGLTITGGQFKLPFLKEELGSAKRLLAIERSMVNRVFRQGRSQGVQVEWEKDRLGSAIAFSDGFNSANTDIDAEPADWALTGRVELSFGEEIRRFRDPSSTPGSRLGGYVGAAGHVERANDDGPNAGQDFESWTLDAGVRGSGWTLQAAIVGRHINNAFGAPTSQSADDYGVLVQGGVFITPTVEAFARYDALLPDGDRPGDDPFQTVTLGANWFIHGHAAKFSIDALWMPDAFDDSDIARIDTGAGVLDSGDGDEFVLRTQFQLLF